MGASESINSKGSTVRISTSIYNEYFQRNELLETELVCLRMNLQGVTDECSTLKRTNVELKGEKETLRRHLQRELANSFDVKTEKNKLVKQLEQKSKELEIRNKDFNQIQTLKDDLLKAEHKITELENVLEVCQREQECKDKNNFSILLRLLQDTKIIDAYRKIVDLKKRADDIRQKSEFQAKNNARQTYEQVKELKDEIQAICGSLKNVRLDNGKIANLEREYFKVRLENDDKSKRIDDVVTHIHNLHRAFMFDFSVNTLHSIELDSEELDKFNEVNYENCCQNEHDLLEQVLKELQFERELLQVIKKSQHLIQ